MIKLKDFWIVLCWQVLLSVFFVIGIQISVFGQNELKWDGPFKKCWEFPAGVDNNDNFASDNNSNIVITDINGSIISLNNENGLENWRSDFGGRPTLNLLLYKNSIYSLSTVDVKKERRLSNIRSIDSSTGITNWQTEIQTMGKASIFQNNEQLFIIDAYGTIYAISKINGKSQWVKNLSGGMIIASLLYTNQLLVFMDKQLISLSEKNGEILESSIINRKVESIIFINDKEYITGNSIGDIYYFSLDHKNHLWSTRIGGGISSFVKTDSGILVSSLDNFVYLFAVKNGELKWKKRVAGRINIKPLVLKKYLIVLNSNNSTATVMDVKNGKTINQINIDENDYFSSTPIVIGKLIIFRTFKGVSAFSTDNCNNKEPTTF